MKVGVTTFGCDAGRSGIGRYAVSLLREFAGSANGDTFRVYGHDSEREVFLQPAPSMEWRSISSRWHSPVTNILWHQVALPHASRDLDVLFLPAGNRRLPARSHIPTVGTVHDFSSMHIAGKYDRARDSYIKKVLPFLIRRLDHVLTVSESTKHDIMNYCGVADENISVIPLAADPASFYQEDRTLCRMNLSRKYGLQKPFLLYIARIEHPGKNHLGLIRAFESLKEREQIPHELVFVGPDRERAEEVHAAASLSRFASEIRFFGYAPGDDLRTFYNAADLFVFPSLYEGFGLPILEAMACGTPVACSNCSSLPEVAGNAAKVFDPCLERGMADSIAAMLNSHVERQTLVERGLRRAGSYTWKKTAEQTRSILRQIANS